METFQQSPTKTKTKTIIIPSARAKSVRYSIKNRKPCCNNNQTNQSIQNLSLYQSQSQLSTDNENTQNYANICTFDICKPTFTCVNDDNGLEKNFSYIYFDVNVEALLKGTVVKNIYSSISKSFGDLPTHTSMVRKQLHRKMVTVVFIKYENVKNVVELKNNTEGKNFFNEDDDNDKDVQVQICMEHFYLRDYLKRGVSPISDNQQEADKSFLVDENTAKTIKLQCRKVHLTSFAYGSMVEARLYVHDTSSMSKIHSAKHFVKYADYYKHHFKCILSDKNIWCKNYFQGLSVMVYLRHQTPAAPFEKLTPNICLNLNLSHRRENNDYSDASTLPNILRNIKGSVHMNYRKFNLDPQPLMNVGVGLCIFVPKQVDDSEYFFDSNKQETETEIICIPIGQINTLSATSGYDSDIYLFDKDNSELFVNFEGIIQEFQTQIQKKQGSTLHSRINDENIYTGIFVLYFGQLFQEENHQQLNFENIIGESTPMGVQF